MPNAVVVVGGGIAGLTVAFELVERARGMADPPEIVCLEASRHTGGNIRSDAFDGWVLEWGPNGFLDNSPPTLDLARRAGLGARLLPADASAAKRFIFRDGALRKLPAGPISFLASDVLSWPGKRRVFREPFVPAKRDESDESIFAFAARRIGDEAARILVSAMVSGIYAGDARSLCLKSTFPKMQRMEVDHGGLVRAMFARRREGRSGGGPAGPGGRLTSFVGGLQEFPDAVARALGPVVQTGARVDGLADMGVRGFRVHLAEGAPIDAGAVVLACPAWHAAEILRPLDSEAGAAAAAVPSAPIAVVHMGFRLDDLPAPLDGFGFLVPRGESPRLLGTLWSSSIFPGRRAPAGHALLTSMVGGSLDPEGAHLDDDALVASVRDDLAATMRIGRPPVMTRIFRHPRGIPQYTLGHQQRLETIARRLATVPGLLVCGNSWRGISVNACVAEAPAVADAALAAMRR